MERGSLAAQEILADPRGDFVAGDAGAGFGFKYEITFAFKLRIADAVFVTINSF